MGRKNLRQGIGILLALLSVTTLINIWQSRGPARASRGGILWAAPANRGEDLARRAREILRQRCATCHSGDGNAFKEVVVDDYARLVGADKPVVPGDSESLLLRMVRAGVMPQAGPKLTEAEIDTLTAWVLSGAPDWETGASIVVRRFMTESEILREIENDLGNADPNLRPDLRYFSLAHLYNAGLPDEDLRSHRVALSKLLNSLSWQTPIAKPQEITPAGTILRINLRDYGWNPILWESVASAYPYKIFNPEYQAVRELSGSSVPYVRVDWFVAHASIPPLYHTLLDLPRTVTELAASLGVNIQNNLLRENFAVRGGVRNSGVSRNNRVLERHESRYGAFWISYDFRSSAGRENIFENPLDFAPAGSEIIFNLPNGSQAYFLANGQGRRIDKGPTDIVFDRTNPDSPEIVNGRSCMGCHVEGTKSFRDDVRPVIARLPATPRREKALALYVHQVRLDQLIQEDVGRFQRAMDRAGSFPVSDPALEPVSFVARRFESALGLERAAVEVDTQPSELRSLIERDTRLKTLGLGQLLAVDGNIKRDVWERQFLEIAEASSARPKARPISQLTASRRPPAEDIRRPSNTDAVLGFARSVSIRSRSLHFKAPALIRALSGMAEFQQLGMVIADDPNDADLNIRLDRPLLTFDFNYEVVDRRSGIVVLSGQVTESSGVLAARKVAREILSRIKAARFGTSLR